MNFEKYVGKFVSVLINGKNDKEENYLGTVDGIENGFMILNTEENVIIDEIAFDTQLIKSIWVYKERTPQQKKLALRDKYYLGYPSANRK